MKAFNSVKTLHKCRKCHRYSFCTENKSKPVENLGPSF